MDAVRGDGPAFVAAFLGCYTDAHLHDGYHPVLFRRRLFLLHSTIEPSLSFYPQQAEQGVASGHLQGVDVWASMDR
jgi:hypothetical protein